MGIRVTLFWSTSSRRRFQQRRSETWSVNKGRPRTVLKTTDEYAKIAAVERETLEGLHDIAV